MNVFSLRQALKATNRRAAFDSAATPEDAPKAAPGSGDYAMRDIALRAVATIQQWAETDDLDEGESYADRLLAMMVGIADSDKDGEITGDEQDLIEYALNVAWDYLASKGATDEDLDALFNEWDDDAADRLRDLVAGELPDGEDAADEEIDNFVFSEDDQEPAYDSARVAYDATYRKVFAVRNGKKVKINKRVAGTVRLSAKQKLAIRKARMKSHSAAAQARRMKSMRVRRRAGL